MKVVIQRIVSVILLIAVFLGFQRLVMPKYTGKVREGGFVQEYYREKNPHEVLMIGDCEVYENFSPVVMWKDYGITTYIRGSAQQLTWQSYYLLRDTLRHEKPDVVVFNVLALKYNKPQSESYNRMTLDGMRWSPDKAADINASMKKSEYFVDYLFPILRFHSRITKLNKNDFRYFATDVQRTTAGYYMRCDVNPYEKGYWNEDKPSDMKLGSNAMGYLDRIRKLCDREGIRLLLVKAPSVSPVWYDEWEEQVQAYADKYHLDYVNFLKDADKVGIDWKTDTYDKGLHMNLSGAEKCGAYLGKYLSENYKLKDMRSDKKISADWEAKVKFYEAKKKSQEDELAKYGELRKSY